MSADNFLGILVTPTLDGKGHEYRVTMLYDSDHCQEGEFCDVYQHDKWQTNATVKQWLMTEARILWGNAKLFKTRDEAWDYTQHEEENEVIEYGAQMFELPEPYQES